MVDRFDHHQRFTRTEAEKEAIGQFEVSPALIAHLEAVFKRTVPLAPRSIDETIIIITHAAYDTGVAAVLAHLRTLLKGDQP